MGLLLWGGGQGAGLKMSLHIGPGPGGLGTAGTHPSVCTLLLLKSCHFSPSSPREAFQHQLLVPEHERPHLPLDPRRTRGDVPTHQLLPQVQAEVGAQPSKLCDFRQILAFSDQICSC